MNEMTPPIGHNSGRVPTPEEIREVLAADHEETVDRLAASERSAQVRV